MELLIALAIVAILGTWVFVLKRKIAELTDQVAVLEAEREKKSVGSKKVGGLGTGGKPGIQTFEIE